MLILEGPDNSGKSTLAAKLKRDLGVRVVHSIRPPQDWTHKMVYEHCLKQIAPQTESCILDRVTCISEAIYGPICRGESALGNYQTEALLDLWSRPYTVIYCRPDDDVILDNQGREQMPGVLENHKRIIEAYDRLMYDLARFATPYVFTYDWKDKTSYTQVKNLVNADKARLASLVQSATFMSAP